MWKVTPVFKVPTHSVQSPNPQCLKSPTPSLQSPNPQCSKSPSPSVQSPDPQCSRLPQCSKSRPPVFKVPIPQCSKSPYPSVQSPRPPVFKVTLVFQVTPSTLMTSDSPTSPLANLDCISLILVMLKSVAAMSTWLRLLPGLELGPPLNDIVAHTKSNSLSKEAMNTVGSETQFKITSRL